MIFLSHDEVTFRLPCLLSKQRGRVIGRGVGMAGRTIACRIRYKIAHDAVSRPRGNGKMPGNNRRLGECGILWKTFLNHM